MTNFPTSKIELHQWVNSILLLIVGFIVRETYVTIKTDHEKLGLHETAIELNKADIQNVKTNVSLLSGRVEIISNNYVKK